ncbi:alpha/beta-hydrolase [Ganoderma leucocontextum]|nr:alpha/beta-hydrolase [Ganoderma leucocontextum]
MTILSFLPFSAAILSWSQVFAQRTVPPNSFPHVWPGQPRTPFGSDWQDYFEVKHPLPNLTHIMLPRSFAGNIPVNRADHSNNTLFFWGFERQGSNGTLTAPATENNTEPWIIWLQGGPGSSSMLGLSKESGPIHITSNGSWVANSFSWNTLADTIWIDQPVGTGYSTSDRQGYITNEDQMGEDFLGFLTNFVSVFPSLATRPLYLMGESYAGTFIPYIVKHLFSASNPPVTLRKVAIGNSFLGSFATVRHLPAINILETYPAIIGYDEDVFNYFREQHHLCGTFPTLNLTLGLRATLLDSKDSRVDRRDVPSWEKSLLKRLTEWKRDAAGQAILDPWYGCDLFDEMWDYALNFTFPWTNGRVDYYDIPDATNPEPPLDPSPFLNSPSVRAALHAPTSKNWSGNFTYPFGSVYDLSRGNPPHGDPSDAPVAFLTPLLANASARGVPFVFFSGNDDSDIQHRATEVIIQNITFGGTQGFIKRPATPWFDDAGARAGIVHQERNVTYVLFEGAGHEVPQWRPAQALVFLREFVLERQPERDSGGEIFYGSARTEGTWTWPSATRAAWDKFIATATLGATKPSSPTNGAAVEGYKCGFLLACNRWGGSSHFGVKTCLLLGGKKYSNEAVS